jgi:hypothetical protein
VVAGELTTADYIGIAALAAAIIGLIVAFFFCADQIKKMKRFRGQLATVRDDLRREVNTVGGELRTVRDDLDRQVIALARAVEEVKGEVSTHFVAMFPKFMDAVVDVLRNADTSIRIFCDQPAFGAFSRPDVYAEYVDLIRAKAEKLDVEMIHLDGEGRNEIRRLQFGGAKPWDERRTADDVKQFIDKHATGEDPGSMTLNRFCQVLEDVQVELLRGKFQQVRAEQTDRFMPLHFWIADGETAVFSVIRIEKGAHEYGFRTKSPNLLEALNGIFEYYRVPLGDSPAARAVVG